MSAKRITGSFVAIITPFNKDGSVDFEAFRSLLKFHQDNGTAAILIMGSTGETSMLSPEEKKKIIVETAKMKTAAMPIFYGCTGNNTDSTIANVKFAKDNGADGAILAAPGTAPALTDLMSGQIQGLADPILSSLPLAQGGKIKALAITSAKRMPSAPDIPTVAESGMKDFEFVSWYGVWGPKGLPPEIVQKLQTEMAKAVKDPGVQERMGVQGFESVGSTADEFAKYVGTEMAKYGKIIKDANIKID